MKRSELISVMETSVKSWKHYKILLFGLRDYSGEMMDRWEKQWCVWVEVETSIYHLDDTVSLFFNLFIDADGR